MIDRWARSVGSVVVGQHSDRPTAGVRRICNPTIFCPLGKRDAVCFESCSAWMIHQQSRESNSFMAEVRRHCFLMPCIYSMIRSVATFFEMFVLGGGICDKPLYYCRYATHSSLPYRALSP